MDGLSCLSISRSPRRGGGCGAKLLPSAVPILVNVLVLLCSLPAEARRRRYIGVAGDSSAVNTVMLVLAAIVGGCIVIYWLSKHLDNVLPILYVLAFGLSVGAPVARTNGWGWGVLAGAGSVVAWAGLSIAYDKTAALIGRRRERRRASRAEPPVPAAPTAPRPFVPSELARVVAAVTRARGAGAPAAYDPIVDAFGASSNERVRAHVAGALLEKAALLADRDAVNDAIACYGIVTARYGQDTNDRVRIQAAKAWRCKAMLFERAGDRSRALGAYESGLKVLLSARSSRAEYEESSELMRTIVDLRSASTDG